MVIIGHILNIQHYSTLSLPVSPGLREVEEGEVCSRVRENWRAFQMLHQVDLSHLYLQ
jgi:hypothetical protein